MAKMSKTENKNIERRILATDDIELRIEGGDGEPSTLQGYAARFNSDSVDLGGFIERIQPGAFKNAIAKSDVRALFNHDPNMILGRNKSGTLWMVEDDNGLEFKIKLPSTQTARDVAEGVSRGDITGCSFSFTTKEDSWHLEDGQEVREIVEVDELFDVGPVVYPAYPDTTVAARSQSVWRNTTEDDLDNKEADEALAEGDFKELKSIEPIDQLEHNKKIRRYDRLVRRLTDGKTTAPESDD